MVERLFWRFLRALLTAEKEGKGDHMAPCPKPPQKRVDPFLNSHYDFAAEHNQTNKCL